MDPQRFDAFARTLAAPGSRRRFLAGLAAGAAGLLGFQRGEASVCRAASIVCRKSGDCCSHYCAPRDATGRRKCACQTPNVACNGVCVDPAAFESDFNNCGACGNACPGPLDGNATCDRGECGVTCDLGAALCNGQCVPNGTIPNGSICCGDDQCISAFCNTGGGGVTFCIGNPLGEDCTDDAQCDSNICNQRDFACTDCDANGSPCVRDVECCSGTCVPQDSTPGLGLCCTPAGQTCLSGTPCCDGTTCVVDGTAMGTCPPAVSPCRAGEVGSTDVQC